VMIKLPELNKNIELLEKVCDAFDLQPRGSAGEHSAAVGAKWDISNKQRIGFSEVQLVQKMIDGITKIIAIEEKLAAGATAADIEASLGATNSSPDDTEEPTAATGGEAGATAAAEAEAKAVAKAEADAAAEAEAKAAAEAEAKAAVEAGAKAAAEAGAKAAAEAGAKAAAEAEVKVAAEAEAGGSGGGGESSAGAFDLKTLQAGCPAGVSAAAKHLALSDADFEATFKMGKVAFGALPKWKQISAKKAAGLF